MRRNFNKKQKERPKKAGFLAQMLSMFWGSSSEAKRDEQLAKGAHTMANAREERKRLKKHQKKYCFHQYKRKA